jgi:cobalt-zinc-cadmium efflux system protein
MPAEREACVGEHSHHGSLNVGSKLKIGIMLTGSIFAVELIGGLLSNSLALLSDAGHVLTDVVALSLSWYGVRQAERPSSSHMTFGYHRVGVIVAIVNALSIFAIAAVILYEAYRRLQEPPEVDSALMLGVAVVGLGINAFVVYWLRREQRENINVRSAFWHALGDALASVGVIVGGIVMLVSEWYWVDPVISVLISLIIVTAAWRILKEASRVLLEASPRHLDVKHMVDALNRTPGVKDVHDVHVWSITPELHSMSCHVLIDDVHVSQASAIRERIEEVLRREFDIKHTTLQMECQQCDTNDVFCSLTFRPGDEDDSEPSSRR